MDVNLNMLWSKISNIIEKLPKMTNNITKIVEYIQCGKLDQKSLFQYCFLYLIVKNDLKNKEKLHSNGASFRPTRRVLIGPPETYNALINARLQFMEIHFGTHRPEHQLLWKNMTSRISGTCEKYGGSKGSGKTHDVRIKQHIQKKRGVSGNSGKS